MDRREDVEVEGAAEAEPVERTASGICPTLPAAVEVVVVEVAKGAREGPGVKVGVRRLHALSASRRQSSETVSLFSNLVEVAGQGDLVEKEEPEGQVRSVEPRWEPAKAAKVAPVERVGAAPAEAVRLVDLHLD